MGDRAPGRTLSAALLGFALFGAACLRMAGGGGAPDTGRRDGDGAADGDGDGAADADRAMIPGVGGVGVGGVAGGAGGGSGGQAPICTGAAAGGPDGGTVVIAATPPMGWNSWNRFQGSVSDSVIRQTADELVASGMAAAGYQYVVIDDTWQVSRDATGAIVADPARFPSMKALADYVHGKGLKLGLYSDRGTQTCGGRPGSYGHETADARTYASWGIDYLKYDNCSPGAGRDNDTAMRDDYKRMGDALRATGCPLVFSLSAWWFYSWEPTVGNLWRTTTDITDDWASVMSLLDKNGGDTSRYADASYGPPGIAANAGPGHWNDPDMLEVGNGGLTATEDRAHFSLWAIMAAPLIAGNDVRTMSETTRETLTNAEVIAVDQDARGQQGRPVSASTTLEVWAKALSGTSTYAVVLLNRTAAEAAITVTWPSLGIASTTASVRDLWAHADLGSVTDHYTATVPAHGVAMLRVVGGQP
jgi:alpha-galactosidase